MGNEKADVNSAVDENGNEISYLAEDMKSGEMMTIINNFKQKFDEAASALAQVLSGDDDSKAKDTIKDLITVCSGGPHIEFAKKNNRLVNNPERDKFLTSGGEIDPLEKNFMIYLVMMVQESTQFRREFMEFLKDCSAGLIESAYKVIRFEQKMIEIYQEEDRRSVVEGFAGFSNLYEKYNHDSIFKTVPIRKSTGTLEENARTLLEYLNKDIKNKPHLNNLLLSAERSNAAGLNALHILDRETKAFAKNIDNKSDFARAKDTCDALDKQLLQCYAVGHHKLSAYFDGYQQVIDLLTDIFEKAYDIIEKFENCKSEVPYAVMHYEPLVKDCVSKYILRDLSDPFTSGTNYSEMAENMTNRYCALVKYVAKCAPD